MARNVSRRVEVPLALGLIVLAGVVLLESGHIPGTVFDALGSAAVPRGVAGLIALLSLLVLVRAARDNRPPEAPAEPVSRIRQLDAAVVLLLTCGFVAAMQAELLGFGWLATLFLVASIGWLERFALRRMPYVLLLAALTGFGLQYVFTRIFIVNLQGL